MRQKLLVGNWKMHGSKAQVSDLITGLITRLESQRDNHGPQVVICPTAVHLDMAASLLADSEIALGAQNAYSQDQGAFTGEWSPSMLAEFSVRYVLVGHSERRQLFGESNALVAQKYVAAQEAGLIPILCVGETLAEREQGRTQERVIEQLDAVLELAGAESLKSAVIAYEPVWAIGTGKTATPVEAQAVHRVLREYIADLGSDLAQQISLLYGGSVNATNAKALFAEPDIDGGLIGGASLKAEEFSKLALAF